MIALRFSLDVFSYLRICLLFKSNEIQTPAKTITTTKIHNCKLKLSSCFCFEIQTHTQIPANETERLHTVQCGYTMCVLGIFIVWCESKWKCVHFQIINIHKRIRMVGIDWTQYECRGTWSLCLVQHKCYLDNKKQWAYSFNFVTS